MSGREETAFPLIQGTDAGPGGEWAGSPAHHSKARGPGIVIQSNRPPSLQIPWWHQCPATAELLPSSSLLDSMPQSNWQHSFYLQTDCKIRTLGKMQAGPAPRIFSSDHAKSGLHPTPWTAAGAGTASQWPWVTGVPGPSSLHLHSQNKQPRKREKAEHLG